MAIRGPKPKDAATRALGPKSHHTKKSAGFTVETAQGVEFPEELQRNLPAPVLARARESFDLLISKKILSPCDIEPFVRYVHHLRLVYEADALIKRNGLAIVDGMGGVHKNPMLQVHRDNSMAALKYEEQFGLTPSARTRISGMETEKEINDYAAFRAK